MRPGDRPRIEVAVVGSVNLDHTVRVGRLPRPGESVVGDLVATVPGGKGANQAVAAARLGVVTALVGCVGEDGGGATVLDVLGGEARLALSGVTRVDAPTGVAWVTVDDAGANTVVSVRGANARLDDELVHRHGSVIAEAAVLLVQLGVPGGAVSAAVDVARSVGTLVVLDPAPADEVTDDLLRRADVCIPNETEVERLTGIAVDGPEGVARAADALLARGCGAVVVTLGARGAYVATAGGVTHAGRAARRCGGRSDRCRRRVRRFARGRARAGVAVEVAVDDAVVAGALATTRLGAVPSLPTRAEVDAAVR